MKTLLITEYYDLTFSDTYAIIKVKKGVHLDLKITNELRRKLRNHYKNRPIVLIADRENDHGIDFNIYKQNRLKNTQALAIVSRNQAERERAMQEQEIFDKSFAFFERLEDAENWAISFSLSK
ncbi:hypothetical protein [Altibacter sp.]|uniref:hypothetical protein n=1 Tax=Altibacter sp. TaxID=2024823 RepID=UPI002586D35F|nr:hypothetical protein [Altibacter sp.]MCW9038439.1 hypothetical protein [Altibacter sp.]